MPWRSFSSCAQSCSLPSSFFSIRSLSWSTVSARVFTSSSLSFISVRVCAKPLTSSSLSRKRCCNCFSSVVRWDLSSAKLAIRCLSSRRSSALRRASSSSRAIFVSSCSLLSAIALYDSICVVATAFEASAALRRASLSFSLASSACFSCSITSKCISHSPSTRRSSRFAARAAFSAELLLLVSVAAAAAAAAAGSGAGAPATRASSLRSLRTSNSSAKPNFSANSPSDISAMSTNVAPSTALEANVSTYRSSPMVANH